MIGTSRRRVTTGLTSSSVILRRAVAAGLIPPIRDAPAPAPDAMASRPPLRSRKRSSPPGPVRPPCSRRRAGDDRRHGLQSDDRPGHPRRVSRLSPRRQNNRRPSTGSRSAPNCGPSIATTDRNIRRALRICAAAARAGLSDVPIDDRRIRPVFIGKRTPPAPLAQPLDNSADAAIVLALRPGVGHQGCGSIAAHCSSRTQKLSATNQALTDLNHDDFRLN